MSNQAFLGDFHGEAAVWLRAGAYEAAVLPEVGANLIALRETAHGFNLLREPQAAEMADFKANPIIHGIPVLFPPNRYEDGVFKWEGSTYQFPVNEPERGNHLHGFVHNIPWQVDHYGADETASRVTLSLRVDADHPVYTHFPHAFTLKLRYTLSADGLEQQFTAINDGTSNLPCLVAFHTAVCAPFAPDSQASDCRVKLTIGERWEMSERMLPSGRFQPLSEPELAMQGDGVYPFFAEMDNHYTARPQNGRNRMELTDSKQNLKLIYDVDNAYKMWMIWNNFATEGFFCPEPQVNLVNAPNVDLPAETSGLFHVAPHDRWEATSRIYLTESSQS